MTTIPHPDSQHSFAAIDAHVQAQAATPSSTGQTAQQRFFARYTTVRPILAALAVVPLIPQNWRSGLTAFLTTADELVVFLETPLTTAPAPLPVNPDFKAGKDQ